VRPRQSRKALLQEQSYKVVSKYNKVLKENRIRDAVKLAYLSGESGAGAIINHQSFLRLTSSPSKQQQDGGRVRA